MSRSPAHHTFERSTGAAGSPLPRGCQRRTPETTVLYELVSAHREPMLRHMREVDPKGYGLPRHVDREFTVPKPLRLVLARNPAWTSWIGGLVVRAIGAWQRRVARRRGIRAPLTGAVTFVQRFGGLVKLNVHFHLVAPDGVFVEDGDDLRFVMQPLAKRPEAKPERHHAELTRERWIGSIACERDEATVERQLHARREVMAKTAPPRRALARDVPPYPPSVAPYTKDTDRGACS